MGHAVAPSPGDDDLGPQDAALVQLELDTWGYRLVWLSVAFVLSFVAAYLVGQITFYVLATTWPLAGYFAETYQLLPRSGFFLAVIANGPICLLYVRNLYHITKLSVRSRQLCLSRSDMPVVWWGTGPADSSPAERRQRSLRLPRTTHSFRAMVERASVFVGVRGEGYEAGTLLRDVFQIISLTLQAYDASRYTVSVALNACFTALIATTCFAGPVIRRLGLRSLAHERFAMLVVDLFVDSTFLVMPIVLFQPYISAYAGEEAIMFRDAYGARALTELRILYVASTFHIFIKLVPPVGVLVTTSKIRELVRRRTEPADAVEQPSLATPNRSASRRWLAVVVPTVSSSTRWIRSLQPTKMARLPLAKNALSVALVAWGIVVVSAFSATVSRTGTCPLGCELVLHPWFVSSRCRCAVQLIDCHARGITGRSHELQRAFSELERTGLATLIFLHCPALEIPREIRWFEDLYRLDVYNASVVSWPMEAAITRRDFPRLGSVYLVRTNVSDVPAALLGSELPDTLKEVAIIASALTRLPHDLDERWRFVKTLYLDHAPLGHVPPVLGRMRLDSLSLYNTSIASIPDDLFQHNKFSFLVLNANPLTDLPRTFGDLTQLHEIQIQYTNISQVAAHQLLSTLSKVKTRIFARGSPLCSDNSSSSPPTTVDCGVRGVLYGGVRSLAYYPLEGKTRERTLT